MRARTPCTAAKNIEARYRDRRGKRERAAGLDAESDLENTRSAGAACGERWGPMQSVGRSGPAPRHRYSQPDIESARVRQGEYRTIPVQRAPESDPQSYGA